MTYTQFLKEINRYDEMTYAYCEVEDDFDEDNWYDDEYDLVFTNPYDDEM